MTENQPDSRVFHAYIDGFNLYIGALSRRPEYKWLDLVSFCESLRPDLELGSVYFFTARVAQRYKGDRAPERQDAYLRVLRDQGVEVVYGKFRKDIRTFRMATKERTELTKPSLPNYLGITQHTLNRFFAQSSPDIPKVAVSKTEEKGSDVNLASYLLRDAYSGLANALVISGDTDLLTPVSFAVESGTNVKVAIPNENQTHSKFHAVASHALTLHTKHLVSHKLPEVYVTVRGREICRPSEWR